MRETVMDSNDDARDKQAEGHAQEQRMQVGACGKECRKDAVERGHIEVGFELLSRERRGCIKQLEFCSIVAD